MKMSSDALTRRMCAGGQVLPGEEGVGQRKNFASENLEVFRQPSKPVELFQPS